MIKSTNMQMPNQVFTHIITNCHDHGWVWVQKETKAMNPSITKLKIANIEFKQTLAKIVSKTLSPKTIFLSQIFILFWLEC
jgi:hypothetical protein